MWPSGAGDEMRWIKARKKVRKKFMVKKLPQKYDFPREKQKQNVKFDVIFRFFVPENFIYAKKYLPQFLHIL